MARVRETKKEKERKTENMQKLHLEEGNGG